MRGRTDEQLVTLIAAAMRSPTLSSPFNLEAAAVMLVRADRCLRGWQWSIADITARRLTKRALDRVHARRPSFEEGQPIPPVAIELHQLAPGDVIGWPAAEREKPAVVWLFGSACLVCGTHVPGARRTGRRYCGKKCEHIGLNRKGREFACAWCGTSFRRAVSPSEPDPRYCGMAHAHKALAWHRRTPEEIIAAIGESSETSHATAARLGVSQAIVKLVRRGVYVGPEPPPAPPIGVCSNLSIPPAGDAEGRPPIPGGEVCTDLGTPPVSPDLGKTPAAEISSDLSTSPAAEFSPDLGKTPAAEFFPDLEKTPTVTSATLDLGGVKARSVPVIEVVATSGENPGRLISPDLGSSKLEPLDFDPPDLVNQSTLDFGSPHLASETAHGITVDDVVAMLASSKFAPFGRQGSTIRAVRSQLCLAGLSFDAAERAACELVADAMAQLGLDYPERAVARGKDWRFV